MSTYAGTINHDEAERIARGWGVSYSVLDDEAAKQVFAAYLELRERVAELEAIATAAMNRADASICSYCERVIAAPPSLEATRAHMEVCGKHPMAALRAQVESLTAQLVAATNDAARAELRARDVTKSLRRFGAHKPGCSGDEVDDCDCGVAAVFSALAANPDSDERLREVMVDVTLAGISCGESRGAAGIFDQPSRDTDAAFIVDKKLRGAP